MQELKEIFNNNSKKVIKKHRKIIINLIIIISNSIINNKIIKQIYKSAGKETLKIYKYI